MDKLKKDCVNEYPAPYVIYGISLDELEDLGYLLQVFRSVLYTNGWYIKSPEKSFAEIAAVIDFYIKDSGEIPKYLERLKGYEQYKQESPAPCLLKLKCRLKKLFKKKGS